MGKNENLILTASNDNTAKLWNAKTEESIRSFEGHRDPVYSAVFSKDENRILTASEDHTAKLWNADTGELIRHFQGHRYSVNSQYFPKMKISFSPHHATTQQSFGMQ